MNAWYAITLNAITLNAITLNAITLDAIILDAIILDAITLNRAYFTLLFNAANRVNIVIRIRTLTIN